MKKSIFFLSLLAAFSFVSCEKSNVEAGDYVTAEFTIVAPEELATKANFIGDGTNAKNLVFAVYPYDFAAGADNTQAVELPDLRQGDWKNGQQAITFGADLTATVKVTLLRGRAYQFVCWAQNPSATCYDFSDMSKIVVDYYGAVSQDDAKRDAFYAYDYTRDASNNVVKVTQGFSQTITLRRPFAQINVGAEDMSAAKSAGLDITKIYSSMTVSGIATELYTLSGQVGKTEDVTFSKALAITQGAGTEMLTVNASGYENKTYGWLAMNYVLVNTKESATNTTHEVVVNLYDDAEELLSSHTTTNVTLARNYRTHLLGNVLTAEGTINVVIDPIFFEPDNVANVPLR